MRLLVTAVSFLLVGSCLGTVGASSILSVPTFTETSDANDAAIPTTVLSQSPGFSQAVRRAVVGDFDELNSLFENAQILIPGTFTYSDRIAWIKLDMTFTNLRCLFITIGDMNMSSQRTSNTNVNVQIDISEVDVTCQMNYEYKYGLIRGTGRATAPTDNNAVSTALQFTSTDFDQYPPNGSNVASCNANLNIVKIDFAGDFLSEIVEVAQRMLRNLLEDKISTIACDELGGLGVSFVENMLDLASEKLAEYRQPMNATLTDPLYLEQTLELPTEVVPLNFQNGNTSMAKLVRLALDQMDGFLGNSDSALFDSGKDSGDGLKINTLIRDYFLDNVTGAFILNPDQTPLNPILYQGEDVMTQTTVTLTEVRVYGLDSMTVFNPLMDIGNYTFQNNLTWATLSVEADLTLNIKPSTLSNAVLVDSVATGITEDITVKFGLENIAVDVALLVILDEVKLGALQMGPLMYTDNLLPCILSALYSAQISGLSVGYPDQITEPTLQGFISPGMDRIVNDAVQAAFTMYTGTLKASLPSIFQTTVRNLINTKLLDKYISDMSNETCPEMAPIGDFIDFRMLLDNETQTYGNIPPMVKGLLDDKLFAVDPDTGTPRINEAFIASWTASQSNISGVLSYPGEFFGGGSKRISVGGLDAEIQLSASDVLIENLDSMGTPMEFLDIILNQPYEMNHTASMGAGDKTLRMSIRISFVFKDQSGLDINNKLEIAVDLADIKAFLQTFMKITEISFLQFPLRDILDLNCWAATVPAPRLGADGVRLEGVAPNVALTELVATIARLNVNVTCLECSSPGMYQLIDLLSTPEAQNGTTTAANNMLDYLTNLAKGDFLQIKIDRFLGDAGRKCPSSQSYDPTFGALAYESAQSSVTSDYGFDYLILVGAVAFGLMFLVGAVMLAVKFFVRRRHRRWISQLLPVQVRALYGRQGQLDEKEAALNASTQSMFTSPDVPLVVRWIMPLVILANIAFFLSGHLSLGATVAVEAQIAGETISVKDFFEFSMARSTMDIWKAGGRALAILILIFSGVWPYTKQLITLYLWFASPLRVSVSRRGSIFLWLDCLAKWSMVDIFVLVVSIAAFHVSINSPDSTWLPPNFYSIDMLVVPMWGLYANMIAQLISQISSHFIIYYHRRIVSRAANALDAKNESEDEVDNTNIVSPVVTEQSLKGSDSNNTEAFALRNHQFSRPHRGDAEKLVVRRGVNPAMLVAALLLTVFVVVGCSIPSFSLEVLGLVGVAVESGQSMESAMTYYSVFTLSQLMMDEARFLDTTADKVGLGTLAGIFVISILIVPVIQAMVLLYQWFCSMSEKRRGRISVILEILQAWQYMEVYILAIFVASWQLGPVSEFMINTYCDNLQETFSLLVSLNIITEENAQCYSVRSSIESGSFLLAAGAALLALINTFVTKAVVQHFREKDEFECRNVDDKLLDETFDDGAHGDLITKIRPVPVLFTDTFRWTLQTAPSSSSREFFTEQTHGLSEDWDASASRRPENQPTIAELNTHSLNEDQDAPKSPEKQPTIAELNTSALREDWDVPTNPEKQPSIWGIRT